MGEFARRSVRIGLAALADFKGMGDEVEESLKGFEVLVLDGGAKGLLYLVVSRDVDRVDAVHPPTPADPLRHPGM